MNIICVKLAIVLTKPAVFPVLQMFKIVVPPKPAVFPMLQMPKVAVPSNQPFSLCCRRFRLQFALHYSRFLCVADA